MNGHDCFGFVDSIEWASARVHVTGWMLTPGGPADRIVLATHDQRVLPCSSVARADLALAFPAIAGAERGGFSVAMDPDEAGDGTKIHHLVAHCDGREVGRMAIAVPERTACAPLPPPELRMRVAGSLEPRIFCSSGLWNSAEVVSAASRHAVPGGFARVLEWGCGCGRMTLHLRRLLRGSDLHAVDTHAPSIEWLQMHSREIHVRATSALPPLPFHDHAFDLVLAASVFPDLTLEAQEVWQAELVRVTAPAGRIVITTLGPRGAAIVNSPTATVQSPELTRQLWSGGARVLEHAEAVFNRHHDLWVFAPSPVQGKNPRTIMASES